MPRPRSSDYQRALAEVRHWLAESGAEVQQRLLSVRRVAERFRVSRRIAHDVVRELARERRVKPPRAPREKTVVVLSSVASAGALAGSDPALQVVQGLQAAGIAARLVVPPKRTSPAQRIAIAEQPALAWVVMPEVSDVPLLRRLGQREVPLILQPDRLIPAEFDVQPCDLVSEDHRDGARRLAGAWQELGCRRPLLWWVGSPTAPRSHWMAERLAGYRDAGLEVKTFLPGLPYHPDAHWSQRTWSALMLGYLYPQVHRRRFDRSPDALVLVNDGFAVAAAMACDALELPHERLRIVGYDHLLRLPEWRSLFGAACTRDLLTCDKGSQRISMAMVQAVQQRLASRDLPPQRIFLRGDVLLTDPLGKALRRWA